MIFFSEEKVESLLNWDDTFKATEVALKAVSARKAVTGQRLFSQIFDTPKCMITMPGYLEDETYGAWACKLISINPENAKRLSPLPQFNANILLLDKETGAFKAIIAGEEVTKWRTAAASAVATKYIHTFGKSKNILSIFGCGQEGKSHAECFNHFFQFEEIRLWNRTTQKANNLTKELNEKYDTKKFQVFEDKESCARGADVIITVTNPGSSSLIKYEWLKKGVHINAVGVPMSDDKQYELDEETYKHAQVYVDSWEGANRELRRLKGYNADMKAEIGEIILGKVSPPNKEQHTVFQSLGLAVQDCAMARMIYDRHLQERE